MLFTEGQINTAGYRFLGEGRVDEAIRLFEFNTELFPDSWNTWDSLGEGLMTAGRYDEAIARYERSLQVNPSNENGVRMLERIRKLKKDE